MQMLYWIIPTLSFLQRIENSLMANISLLFITILNWRKGQKIVPFHRIKAGLPFRRTVHWHRESGPRAVSSCLKKTEVYKAEAVRVTGKTVCVCVCVLGGHGCILEATASRLLTGMHSIQFWREEWALCLDWEAGVLASISAPKTSCVILIISTSWALVSL